MLNRWRSVKYRLARWVCHAAGRAAARLLPLQLVHAPVGRPAVLLLGICLGDERNTLEHLVGRFGESQYCAVTQAWVVIGCTVPDVQRVDVSIHHQARRTPRMSLLNDMLARVTVDAYDYIVVCDDDVLLRAGFVDAFIGWQQYLDFSLAQPARTRNSYIDHPVVLRDPRLAARETNFVEIGPVVSVHRRAVPLILPFDASSPMGWGLDFVWPCLLHAHGLSLGIIDAAPVDHSLRRPGQTYAKAGALSDMALYLERHEHVAPADIGKIVTSYPLGMTRVKH